MDIGKNLSESWEKFLNNIVTLVLFYLVGSLLMITIILIPTVVRGFARGFLDMVREGKEPQYDMLWDFQGYLEMLLLLVVAGIAITIGFILLVIPGLFLSILFMYAIFFAVDRNMDFMAALKASSGLVMSALGDHFVVWIIFSALMTLGGSLAGVGAFITGPLAMLILARAYLDSAPGTAGSTAF